jgi:rare lipoprotein A
LLRLARLLWVLLCVGAIVVALDDGRAAADRGLASHYGGGFEGSPTASGEVFHPDGFTAAHRTLPFGTRLTVNYHGRSVQVVVNDRGPYIGGRELDLSRAAAEYLGLTRVGVDWVDYTVAGRGGYGAGSSAGYDAERSAVSARDSGGHRYAQDRPDTGGGSYYVVRPGDTLTGISAELGTSVRSLASTNGIPNPNVISVGQKIFY